MNRTLAIILQIIGTSLGFWAGQLYCHNMAKNEIKTIEKCHSPEISVVSLEERKGDLLKIFISGKSRIVWNDQSLEKEGAHEIPLGQIPSEKDLKFEEFPYLGNTKTKKFYPSNTYQARGTAVKYRRFFQNKTEALQAGFEASKLVK